MRAILRISVFGDFGFIDKGCGYLPCFSSVHERHWLMLASRMTRSSSYLHWVDAVLQFTETDRIWPKLIESDRKWLYLTQSDRIWHNVTEFDRMCPNTTYSSSQIVCMSCWLQLCPLGSLLHSAAGDVHIQRNMTDASPDTSKDRKRAGGSVMRTLLQPCWAAADTAVRLMTFPTCWGCDVGCKTTKWFALNVAAVLGTVVDDHRTFTSVAMSLTPWPTTRHVHAVKSSFEEGWWLTIGMLIICRSTCQIRSDSANCMSDSVNFGRIQSDSVNCMTRWTWLDHSLV